MLGRAVTRQIVVGIGLSSQATSEEVAALVDQTLLREGLSRHDVTLVASRERFQADPRLALGAPVVGLPDPELVERSKATNRQFGIQSRIAETAALLAAVRCGTASGEVGAVLIVSTRRSAHATAAVATVRSNPEARQ